MTIGEFRGKLAWGIVMELSRQVKIDLGIIEETTAKSDQNKEMIVEDEEPEEPPQQQQRQVPRPMQKQPKQEVEDLITEVHLGIFKNVTSQTNIQEFEDRIKQILESARGKTESEAKKRNIYITSDIIDQEVSRKLNEYGTSDYLKENLQKLYGWNTDDFKENIVGPDLYKERLAENIKKNSSDFIEAKKQAEAAATDLKNGMSFSEVVKKYSQGDSAKNEGELGWFNAEQILPELIMPVFNLGKNQMSDVIESSVGFHIVKLEDKKIEDNVQMVKVSQIFLRTQSFSDWLNEVEKDYKIIIPMKEFKWNSEDRTVEFRDKEMKDYEQELLKNPVNDPSILF
jgi:parvulin-like peptidyl-prolyl isomerase